MGLNVGLFTCFVHVAPIASRLYTILPVRPWSGNEDQLSIYLLLSAVDYGILVHLVGLAWRCELHHRHSGGRQFHSVVWISNWQSDSRWLSQRNRRNNSLRSRASQDDSGRNWSMNPSIAGLVTVAMVVQAGHVTLSVIGAIPQARPGSRQPLLCAMLESACGDRRLVQDSCSPTRFLIR